MRLLVIGKNGQLATGLRQACARQGIRLEQIGRPEIDLEAPRQIAHHVAARQPDVVINAAAYTAVDAAETDEAAAMRINADAAGEIARGAAMAGAVIIHVSTDYVFDGAKPIPYLESDPTAPLGAYGRSKLEGERRVAAENARHVIARTSWVYSPHGGNFVRSMLRLGETRKELGIVADQLGAPTSADDLAAALLAIAARVRSEPHADLLGITHVCGTGIASWYDVARQTFRAAAGHGYAPPLVKPIRSADYPTPAARPANSRLDTRRLEALFGIALPEWSASVARDVARLLDGRAAPGGREA